MLECQKQQGVTLLELLVVVAIAAILATIAVPSLSNFVRDNRLTSARLQLVGDLNAAKSEAIKRNSRVLICSGTVVGCGNAADWAATGWIICYDADRNDACDVDATGTNPNPITVRDPLRVGAQGVGLAGPAIPVYFNPVGTQGAVGNAGVQFNITGSWAGYTGTRTVNVSTIGSITSH